MSVSNGDAKWGSEEMHDQSTVGPVHRVRADQRTTAQLSAQERSKLTDALIAQVGELTRANNELHARLVELEQKHKLDDNWIVSTMGKMETLGIYRYDVVRDIWRSNVAEESREHAKRLDAIERRTAVMSTSFMARLRGLLTGR